VQAQDIDEPMKYSLSSLQAVLSALSSVLINPQFHDGVSNMPQ